MSESVIVEDVLDGARGVARDVSVWDCHKIYPVSVTV